MLHSEGEGDSGLHYAAKWVTKSLAALSIPSLAPFLLFLFLLFLSLFFLQRVFSYENTKDKSYNSNNKKNNEDKNMRHSKQASKRHNLVNWHPILSPT